MRKNVAKTMTMKDRFEQKKKNSYMNSPEGKRMRAIFGDTYFKAYEN